MKRAALELLAALLVTFAPSRCGSAPPGSPSPSAGGPEVEREEPEQDAHRIVGRVVLPPGTPEDERVAVVIQAQHSYNGKAYRAPVSEDGSFHFSLAADVTTGWLDVDAKYLFLPKSVETTVPNDEVIVLEPELGGRIEVQLELPTGTPVEEPAYWEEATLWVFSQFDPPLPSGLGGNSVSYELEDDSPIALNALSVHGSYALRLAGLSFVNTSRPGLRVEAGRTKIVKIQLLQGTTFTGRVTDNEGRGLARVHVIATCEREPGMWRDDAHAQSDEAGFYSITGVPPGRVALTFCHSERVPRALEPIEGRDGEIQDVPDTVLDRGASIRGTVGWPDGSAAIGAKIGIIDQGMQCPKWLILPGYDTDAKRADRNGFFAIHGLPLQPCAVIAQATPPDSIASAMMDATIDAEPVVWTARAMATPGQGMLRLVLYPPGTVTGSVVDIEGRPVEDFQVTATPCVGPYETIRAMRSVTGGPTSTTGTFALPGLSHGEWKLQASAEGWLPSVPVPITVPLGESPTPTLLLRRAVTLRGRVLDPLGLALQEAEVRLTYNDEQEEEAFWSPSTRTDLEGRFELRGVRPGVVDLWVWDGKLKRSPTLQLRLQDGEVLEGLEVQYR